MKINHSKEAVDKYIADYHRVETFGDMELAALTR